MIRINHNFTLIPRSYLFSEIARKVSEFQKTNPESKIIRMGIGDVSLPLAPAAIEALHKAVDEQADATTFHGYGPEQGHDFLRNLIARHDYHDRGIDIKADEIFISDGAKSDLGNIGDILSPDCIVAITDPVYPVYVDTNAMAGRAGLPLDNGCWSNIVYLPATADNGFCPALPDRVPDVIYLCYPNNPTGTTLSREQLQRWVDYAVANDCLILFDSAYEAYISSPDVPHSIFELPGARKCAIEFRSFSKTAGFTGMRLGYTVVPHDLKGVDSCGNQVSLNQLWLRRQSTKFNGASFVVQRAAAALYTPEGREQIARSISIYMDNARILRRALTEAGLKVYGGIDAPYIWAATPDGLSSWQFFDLLLERLNIVVTPGVGFGPSGEGYVRLTAFSSPEATREAARRLQELRELLK
ncbi:MAG: LL-diaminopimelate aminotransferase [Bacteroides sp.]|nr:LL-diaminopimelate aminotransferase [Bacteroides sp.]MCM1414079.1 LL-diaminopimelate aminotransferase [Bacteroides sp.]MCM1472322.1 LL-diaminopimelate aminotransferase [Bacteroides sp.]